MVKLTEKEIIVPTISGTLTNIIQGWLNSNQTRLNGWGIDLEQIPEDLLSSEHKNHTKHPSKKYL